MKNIKAVVCGSLLAINVIYSAIALSAGSIILRNKDNDICTLFVPDPGSSVTFNLDRAGNGKCAINSARSIQFAEIPSATQIELFDNGDCEIVSTDKFHIDLRTTHKQTSTSIIEIAYLNTFEDGTIVEPGLKLTYGNVKQGHTARDNLDCVRIITSAKAPG